MVEASARDGVKEPPTVEVGVRLGQVPGEIGEWLGDAAAFDAAGADALWVDTGPEPGLDVPALAAALAVLTYRSRLMVAIPDAAVRRAGLAHALDTIDRLSRGRLALVADDRYEELAVLAPGLQVLRRLPEPGTFAGGEAERWVSVPAAGGRAAWRTACADAAERGARGVITPANPLLLDILRNPDDPEGRPDLALSQG